MRRTILAGVAISSLAAIAISGPASAKDQGLCELQFSPKTLAAVSDIAMIKATGKATNVADGLFTFPGNALDQDTIACKGGLAFVRADASVKIKKPVFDLANDTVAVTIPGVGQDYELFDLANVKEKKKVVKAKANLAMGQAALLNQALKTDIFTDGMRIGRVAYSMQ